MIHLDTSFLIQALVPSSAAEAKLRSWLQSGDDLGISSIAWSEFLCGPLTHAAEALAEVLFASPEPFLAQDALKAAQLLMPLVVDREVSRTVKSAQSHRDATPLLLRLTLQALLRSKRMV